MRSSTAANQFGLDDSRAAAAWFWTGALPAWWLSGIPFGGALVFFGSPTLPMFGAMLVVLDVAGFAARRALNDS